MACRCTLVMFNYVQCFIASDVLTTDPCPSNIDNDIVVTMCENNVATEYTADGVILVDSVVLRVAKQQDNCVCSIGIKFQVNAGNDDTLYMQKYDGFIGSAPTGSNCGLELDISSADHTQKLKPITCLEGYDKRRFYSPDNKRLYLTSRKTTDPFKSGYCLQFYRNSTQASPATLLIECFDPTENNMTTAYQVSTNGQSNSKQTTNTEEMITEQIGITNETLSVSTIPSAGTTTHMDNKKDTVLLPVAIVGWIVVAILIIVIILDKSRKISEKRNEERNNKQLNYEIPNCLRRDSANYSDLDHIEI